MRMAQQTGTKRQWNEVRGEARSVPHGGFPAAMATALVVSLISFPLLSCVKKTSTSQAAKDAEILIAPPIAPGQMGLTSETQAESEQGGSASEKAAEEPLPSGAESSPDSKLASTFESKLNIMLPEVALSLGCEGSFKTAFEEAARAQEKALDLELSRRKSRGAADRELWRQARLSAVRSFAKSLDGQASSDFTGVDAEGGDLGQDSEGPDSVDTAATSLLQGSKGRRGNAHWTDDSVRCKTLGTLFASTAHLANLAKTEGQAASPLCDAVTPARFGSLAATLSCRVQARGELGSTFVKQALNRTGSLAPSCGEGFARACAEIVRSRLAESPNAECVALAATGETLANLQAWGCKTPL
jgi:hypothetical protein